MPGSTVLANEPSARVMWEPFLLPLQSLFLVPLLDYLFNSPLFPFDCLIYKLQLLCLQDFCKERIAAVAAAAYGRKKEQVLSFLEFLRRPKPL